MQSPHHKIVIMTGTHLRITLLPKHVQGVGFHSQNQKEKKKRKVLYASNILLPKICGRGAGSHTSRVPPLPPHLQVLPARAPRPPILGAGSSWEPVLRSSRQRPHGPQLIPVSPGCVAYTSMWPLPRRTQPLEKNLTLRPRRSAHRLCACV